MNISGPTFDDAEPLVTAMTRPPMIGGLSMAALFFSLYIPVLAQMITRSMTIGVVLAIVCGVTSWLVCLKDVYLFEIAIAATNLKGCRNKSIWKCRRYAPR